MTSILKVLVIGVALSASVVSAADSTPQSSLTLDGARRVVAAAAKYAREHAAPGGAIAVVDAGGHTILVERLDGTFPAGSDISVGKARTAVMFRRPTRAIEETINKGRAAMTPLAAVTWFTPLQGGIPILANGAVIGGIGVSGAASAQQDEEIALAGASVLANNAPTASVNHVPARSVRVAYTKGEAGDTLVADERFRVNASRRDRAGEAEIHTLETDIFYILEGRATVITGGDIVAPRVVMPNEIRGEAIRGGDEHLLQPGDVLTIPRGVPHWFKSVTTPFRYYVVKSITGE
jgi:uncharacterized protein GlcG (DUF336 family)/mannose-6-phosphate isomerase-like protein (cupin superfamily)